MLLFWVRGMLHSVSVQKSKWSVDYVTHSVANMRGFDFLPSILKQGYIEPHHLPKAGFSINGCYALCGKSTSPHYAVFVFDFKDVKDKLVPTLYFPLRHYDWYDFGDFMVTWSNLAWETELCLKKGNRIDLGLCKAIVVSRRKKRLREKLLRLGFTIWDSLPITPMHEWASIHASSRSDMDLRNKLSDVYNAFVCELYGLDYNKIKWNFTRLIEEREVARIGRKCCICKHYELTINLFNEPLRVKRLCKRHEQPTEKDGICSEWCFNIDEFLDMEAWKKHYIT